MVWTFNVEEHIVTREQMVECLRDGEFVAAIYPCKDGLHVVSKFITGVDETRNDPPRSVVIKLKDSE